MKKLEKRTPPPPLSKDVIEHLRTVHFGLIALSAAISLIAQSRKPYDANVALMQLRQIMQIERSWSPRWIRQMFYDTTVRSTDREHSLRLDAYDEDTTGVRLLYATLHFKTEPTVYVQLRLPLRSLITPTLPGPSTLESFKRTWSQTDTYQITEAIQRQADAQVFHSLEVASTELTLSPQAPTGSEVLTLNLVAKNNCSTESTTQKDFTYCWIIPNREIQITAVATQVRDIKVTDPRNMYEVHRPLSENWSQPFDQRFRDLKLATDTIDSLEEQDIEKVLSEEVSKGHNDLEAFGLKIPYDHTSLATIVLLIGTQIYLYIYLAQVSERIQPGDPMLDYPWIGVSPLKWAKILLFLTFVPLPSIAIFILGYSTGLSQSNGQAQVGTFTSFTLVSLLSFYIGWKCWFIRPLAALAPKRPVKQVIEVESEDGHEM